MKPIDIPSPAFMARFMPKADSIGVSKARPRKARNPRWYAPRPDNPIVKAACELGRFTALDVAKACGATVKQARAALYTMSLHGMLRRVDVSSTVPATYERIDGSLFNGRTKSPAKLAIAAMPIGQRFGWADLPGGRAVKANAVLHARQIGMIRRVTSRMKYTTWETSK